MAEDSKIQWCDHTFNPWVGCEKVSPGCDNCYAESWSKRTGNAHLWAGERRRTSLTNWRLPEKWNRRAEVERNAWQSGLRLFGLDEAEVIARGYIKPKRPRVFCASLADVFDNQVPEHWRWDLFRLIAATPHLDWLLLTKRIGNARAMLNSATSAVVNDYVGALSWDTAPWPNVWLGATVVNQDEADRDLPKLLETPAALRWVSAEPLLAALNLRLWLPFTTRGRGGDHREKGGLDWIVVGGESGPGARPFDVQWARSTVDQCKAAGVPVFCKQLGSNHRGWCASETKELCGPDHVEEYEVCDAYEASEQGKHCEDYGRRCVFMRDRKGGLMEEWPSDLRVREFPEVRT